MCDVQRLTARARAREGRVKGMNAHGALRPGVGQAALVARETPLRPRINGFTVRARTLPAACGVVAGGSP
jgi:hypothetical protein